MDKYTIPIGTRDNDKPMGISLIPAILRNWTARFLITFSAFAVAMPLVLAGQYELVKGEGVEVCEAYKKNLNSFSKLRYPMACERKINPEMKDFSQPNWKEVDAWQNKELIRKIAKFLEPNAKSIDVNIDYWFSNLKEGIKNGHVRLSAVFIDIDNDEKADNVAKYIDGACGMAHLYSTPIVVLDGEGKQLDIEKTKPLLQNDSMDREKYPAGGWHYSMYDIFLYKNQVYFDKWSDVESETGFLQVYKTEKNKTRKLCKYKYHDTTN